MPADERDVRRVGLRHLLRCQIGIEAADDDARGLEVDRLAECRLDANGRALSIDHPDAPSDDLRGFDDALRDACDAGVGHGLGDIGDGLAGNRRGAADRPVPGDVGFLRLLNVRLGLGESGRATDLRRPPKGGPDTGRHAALTADDNGGGCCQQSCGSQRGAAVRVHGCSLRRGMTARGFHRRSRTGRQAAHGLSWEGGRPSAAWPTASRVNGGVR